LLSFTLTAFVDRVFLGSKAGWTEKRESCQ